MVIIFYKIGTLIIGGTPVTLPFLHAEIVNNKLNISEDMMWIGFSLAAALVIYPLKLSQDRIWTSQYFLEPTQED